MKKLAMAVLALAGVAAAAGCGDDTKYGYFSVKVTLDEKATAPYRQAISYCGANVEGADTDFAPLACSRGSVTSNELGTFEYSTAVTAGSLHFVVVLKDVAGNEIGRGQSPDVPINSGGVVNTTVVVTPNERGLMITM